LTRLTRDAAWLAVRAIRAAPGRFCVLSAALGVALGLPLITWQAGSQAGEALRQRASATPVVLGAPGDTFDLVFGALYFRPGSGPPLHWSVVEQARSLDLVLAPLHVRHRADGVPVVGTSPEYFELRGLEASAGRLPTMLGEVVVGARVARERGLVPGHTLRADVSVLHDLSGEAPLTLAVTGVLASAGTADDRAIFTDVRTAWALDGSLHGHAAVEEEQALPGGSSEDHLRASGAVVPADPVVGGTQDFHLHGDLDDQPLTAVLAFPESQAAHDLLLDRAATVPGLRAVRPGPVVDELLAVGHRVRDGLLLFLGLMAGAMVALVGLVLSLGRRLRRQEAGLLVRLGSHPDLLPAMHALESLLLLAVGLAVAAVLTLAARAALAEVLS